MRCPQAVEGEGPAPATFRRQQAGILSTTIDELQQRRRDHLVEEGCDISSGEIKDPPVALIQQSNRILQCCMFAARLIAVTAGQLYTPGL